MLVFLVSDCHADLCNTSNGCQQLTGFVWRRSICKVKEVRVVQECGLAPHRPEACHILSCNIGRNVSLRHGHMTHLHEIGAPGCLRAMTEGRSSEQAHTDPALPPSAWQPPWPEWSATCSSPDCPSCRKVASPDQHKPFLLPTAKQFLCIHSLCLCIDGCMPPPKPPLIALLSAPHRCGYKRYQKPLEKPPEAEDSIGNASVTEVALMNQIMGGLGMRRQKSCLRWGMKARALLLSFPCGISFALAASVSKLAISDHLLPSAWHCRVHLPHQMMIEHSIVYPKREAVT